MHVRSLAPPPPRPLPFPKNQPLLDGLELTDAQRQTLDRVHKAIAADFALRRRMLLRRCDVTVNSFLRDSSGGKEGEDGRVGEGGEAAGVGGGGGGGGDGRFKDLPAALRVRSRRSFNSVRL